MADKGKGKKGEDNGKKSLDKIIKERERTLIETLHDYGPIFMCNSCFLIIQRII